MSAIRDLLSDLVERRLWPVAALLLAALVAVPLVLAKSPSSPSSSTPVPAAAGQGPPPATPAAAVPAVSLAQSAPQAALRGPERNPFRQQFVQRQSTAAAPVSGSSPTPAPSAPSGGSQGGGSQGGAPAHPHSPAPPAKTFLTASIDVRFGKAAGHLRTIRNVARLTPLPSARNPIVIFLGMRKDLKTAVFMISTDVHAQGDGRCVPSRRDCQTIELTEGQTAFLDHAAASGEVTQYELDLDRVTVNATTSRAAALAAYARVSRKGARLLRRRAGASTEATPLGPLVLPFRYAPGSGVLHVALRAYRAARRRRAALAETAPVTATPQP